jgi:hypothetical protein
LTAEKVALPKSVVVPLNERMVFPIGGLGFTHIRGRVAIDDGSRPNDIGGSVRFFVFTAEPDAERLVKIKGDAPVPSLPHLKSVDQAIDEVYLTLFSRQPTPAERKVARAFFVEPGSQKESLQPAAVEDFLWSALLHPDFQYVY